MKGIVLDNMNVLLREEQPTLEFLQKYVGGYIEVVFLKDGGQLVVNEDGQRHGLHLNDHASLVNLTIGNGDGVLGRAVHLYDKALLD